MTVRCLCLTTVRDPMPALTGTCLHEAMLCANKQEARRRTIHAAVFHDIPSRVHRCAPWAKRCARVSWNSSAVGGRSLMATGVSTMSS